MKNISVKDVIEMLKDGYKIKENNYNYTYRVVIDNGAGCMDTELYYLTMRQMWKLQDENIIKKDYSGWMFNYYIYNNEVNK